MIYIIFISLFNSLIRSIGYQISPITTKKYNAELNFWKLEILNYQKWYNNELTEHYGEPSPKEEEKVKKYSTKDNAILTWLEIHQKQKYLEDLSLGKTDFLGLRVLDIGSGPIPSASVFEGCELYCLDPLIPCYIQAGFPIHYYNNVKFIYAFSENIPIEDNFFDVIISVNAIDHVDDIFQTSMEIKRVLKKNGTLRMHIHYHKKTLTEPIELNDEVIKAAFDWCTGFCKIEEKKSKRGSIICNEHESYTLWSN